MFCSSCGSKNEGNSQYCISCGTRISGVSSFAPSPAAASAVVPVAAAPLAAAPAVAPVAATPAAAPAVAPALTPAAIAAPDNLVAGYRLAGIGARVIAVVLDAIFLCIVYAVIGMAVAARKGGITENGFSFTGVPAALAIGATVLFGFLYYWLSEALLGATLGKAIAGIRVRKKDGGNCGIGPSLIRNLLRAIDAIGVYLVGFLIAILSKSRQRLGDLAARTVVVEHKISGAVRAVLVLLWFIMVGGGLAGAYLIQQNAPDAARVTGPFVPLQPAIAVKSTGRLKAGNFNFLESKGGPVRASSVYKPGDNVQIKYDVIGYGRDQNETPSLLFDLVVLDPAGVPVHEPWKTHFNSAIDKGAPVNGWLGVELPDFIPSGDYKIGINVHDAIRNTDLSLTPAFRVDAAVVTPARGLEMRDFQLSLSSGGPPDPVPVLAGEGTVYMKGNIFGLQFQGDHVAAKMALKLMGPDGTVLLDKPDYLDLRVSAFYHPATFRVPVTGQLSIPAGSPKGIYTEQYMVVDNTSNQTVNLEATFEVR